MARPTVRVRLVIPPILAALTDDLVRLGFPLDPELWAALLLEHVVTVIE